MVDTHARPKFKTPRSNPLQPKPSIPTPQTRILRTTPKTKMWLTGAGIVVDTHVHRVSRRLGWAPSGQGTSPETTRNALEEYPPNPQIYSRMKWLELELVVVSRVAKGVPLSCSF